MQFHRRRCDPYLPKPRHGRRMRREPIRQATDNASDPSNQAVPTCDRQGIYIAIVQSEDYQTQIGIAYREITEANAASILSSHGSRLLLTRPRLRLFAASAHGRLWHEAADCCHAEIWSLSEGSGHRRIFSFPGRYL